jgi:hypothetical protein
MGDYMAPPDLWEIYDLAEKFVNEKFGKDEMRDVDRRLTILNVMRMLIDLQNSSKSQ